LGSEFSAQDAVQILAGPVGGPCYTLKSVLVWLAALIGCGRTKMGLLV